MNEFSSVFGFLRSTAKLLYDVFQSVGSFLTQEVFEGMTVGALMFGSGIFVLLGIILAKWIIDFIN